MKLYGIAAAARTGKTTLAKHLRAQLIRNGHKCEIIHLADTLKELLNRTIGQEIGIDFFNIEGQQKEDCRFIMISVANYLRQQTQGTYFIKSLLTKIRKLNNDDITVIVPDLRFDEYQNDERYYIQHYGFFDFFYREEIPPANSFEQKNNALLKQKASNIIPLPPIDSPAYSLLIETIASKIAEFPHKTLDIN